MTEVSEMTVPGFRYSFTKSDIEAVIGQIRELLESGTHLTMGRHGAALEQEFAAYTGVKSVVAVSSGTAALEAILLGVGVSGGEVLVPTNTFGATAVAVQRAGGTPVFVDISPDMSIDVEDVRRKITPNARAVVTVHIGGMISPSVLNLADLCATSGIALVEDAAHAAGATLDGHHAGSFGVGAAYSLFSTKVVTSGEGGLVATDDEGLARRLRQLRDHGKDAAGLMEFVGYNWRLTEIQAIVARRQLATIEEVINSRMRAAERYSAALAGIPGIRIVEPSPRCRSNYYKYVIELENREQADVVRRLREEHGIRSGGSVYEVPCHRQEAFQSIVIGKFPMADRLCPAHFCPPVLPYMANAEIEHTVTALRTVLTS